jgi:hypothetical protein
VRTKDLISFSVASVSSQRDAEPPAETKERSGSGHARLHLRLEMTGVVTANKVFVKALCGL